MSERTDKTPESHIPDEQCREAVDRAVKRCVASWAEGRSLTVDQALDTPASEPGHKLTREMVVRALSDFASRVTADLPGASAPSWIENPSLGSMDTRALIGERGAMGMPAVEGYDLVRRLGHGGMGVVFEAVQHATGRRVAIKFLLDSILGSEAARKRFEREVDVVAGLQHPGIVSILDSGIRKGRYFYVMEYVEGRPLDEAFKIGECDPRRALELLTEVCDAVDYAHQRGVLHRDLKPSNIIIDGAGKPHLLDFGLAKRVEEESESGERRVTMSQPGQLLGTVAYMSPEQSLGKSHETSVRTDVYSLGVIGYELLTGKMPVEVDSGSLREILTRIAEHDPRPLSTLRPGIGKDVDAVLLKALEKIPERRYATAAMFADDIRRSLAFLPVSARRIGPTGRAWRWARRNRALAGVIATAALVLISVSATLIGRIVQEKNAANENFALLRGMLESANPDLAGEQTARQFLDSATKHLEDNPPRRDMTEVTLREILGSVYRKIGAYDKAEKNLSRALEIRERHASGANAELATCLHNLAATYWWEGEFDKAEAMYVRSLEMRRELHSGDDADVAASLTHLAAFHLRQGKVADAFRMYTEALEMRGRLYGPEHEDVAASLNNLAKTYVESEDFDRAEDLFRQAYAMIVKVKGENYSATASALQNLAECLLEKGDAVAARESYSKALAIRKAFYKDHHLIGASMIGVARANLVLGNISDAEQFAKDGIEIHRGKNRTDADFAEGLLVLGNVLVKSGHSAEAEPIMRQALLVTVKAKPPAPLQVAIVKGELGAYLSENGKRAEARTLLEESFDTLRHVRGERSKLTAVAANRLEKVLRSEGEDSKADEIERLMQAAKK